ncbi:tyrosine-protein phosphatase [bacterium]|nr:tyrosine-protein phosphatase [bacterium]
MKESKNSITDIRIERMDEHRVKIHWKTTLSHEPISIYQASSPRFAAPRKLINKTNQQYLIVEDPQGEKRNYYQLVAENTNGIWVGERCVAMAGTVNFRDLGGYRAINGKQTRWGRIFRGDSLQRATKTDLQLIKQMQIGLVFDFRRNEEVEKGPNRFPENHPLDYQHIPVTHGEFNFMNALERLKKNKSDSIRKETIIKGYIENAENFATTWGTVLKHLARVDCPPLFFHCTAGKDRTGICAALILSVLQIPREIIMSDYLLSNDCIQVVWQRVQTMIQEQGIDPEKLRPFFTAPEYAMTALLDHLETTYGSVINFVKTKADVSQETIDKMREKILE